MTWTTKQLPGAQQPTNRGRRRAHLLHKDKPPTGLRDVSFYTVSQSSVPWQWHTEPRACSSHTVLHTKPTSGSTVWRTKRIHSLTPLFLSIPCLSSTPHSLTPSSHLRQINLHLLPFLTAQKYLHFSTGWLYWPLTKLNEPYDKNLLSKQSSAVYLRKM